MTRPSRRRATPTRARRSLATLAAAPLPPGEAGEYVRGWRDALAAAGYVLTLALDGADPVPPWRRCEAEGCTDVAPPGAEACHAHRCATVWASGRRCPNPAGKRGDHPHRLCPRCATVAGRARARAATTASPA